MQRGDFQSETWRRIDAHLRQELDKLRRENDKPDLTDTQTATLRGRILQIKRILAMPTDIAGQGDDLGS